MYVSLDRIKEQAVVGDHIEFVYNKGFGQVTNREGWILEFVDCKNGSQIVRVDHGGDVVKSYNILKMELTSVS